jgi:hypothetical protein
LAHASIIAIILVGALLVLLRIRAVPNSFDDGHVVALSSLLLIGLGEVALIAAGVLQVVGARRA